MGYGVVKGMAACCVLVRRGPVAGIGSVHPSQSNPSPLLFEQVPRSGGHIGGTDGRQPNWIFPQGPSVSERLTVASPLSLDRTKQ